MFGYSELSLSLFVSLSGGLAGTRMSPFWILLELRMMEVVVTTGTSQIFTTNKPISNTWMALKGRNR